MAMLFLISYDLTEPGKNYARLSQRLIELGAERVLYSEWMLKSDVPHAELRDDLGRYLDETDRLLVVQLGPQAAWRNLLISNEKFKGYFS